MKALPGHRKIGRGACRSTGVDGVGLLKLSRHGTFKGVVVSARRSAHWCGPVGVRGAVTCMSSALPHQRKANVPRTHAADTRICCAGCRGRWQCQVKGMCLELQESSRLALSHMPNSICWQRGSSAWLGTARRAPARAVAAAVLARLGRHATCAFAHPTGAAAVAPVRRTDRRGPPRRCRCLCVGFTAAPAIRAGRA